MKITMRLFALLMVVCAAGITTSQAGLFDISGGSGDKKETKPKKEKGSSQDKETEKKKKAEKKDKEKQLKAGKVPKAAKASKEGKAPKQEKAPKEGKLQQKASKAKKKDKSKDTDSLGISGIDSSAPSPISIPELAQALAAQTQLQASSVQQQDSVSASDSTAPVVLVVEQPIPDQQQALMQAPVSLQAPIAPVASPSIPVQALTTASVDPIVGSADQSSSTEQTSDADFDGMFDDLESTQSDSSDLEDLDDLDSSFNS